MDQALRRRAVSPTIETVPVPLSQDADGALRVGETRVTLDTVVEAFQEGCTAEEIAQQYPSLKLPDVYTVLGYYLNHRDPLDAYLADRQRLGDEVRRWNQARHDPAGIRDRLLARRLSSLG
jgi:uncharacterized protein (DUF433 family)